MFDKIRSDFRAVFEMDPAATSKVEVIFTYAGFHAIFMHRIAHWVHRMGMPFFARCISQLARFLTGIEIHPAAKIGGSFFIDHGMGVVIGETTEIGEHVILFQGATLGGTGKERGKRHPTLGDYVVVGTGAKVLGAIKIGDHVKVGANAVVLTSVPPHSTVVGVPGRVVKVHGEKTAEAAMLDHIHMPDPVKEELASMQRQISRLEQKLGGGAPVSSGMPVEQGQGKRGRRGKKGLALPQRGVKVEQLPVESVQERQARMARMERDERMKAVAIRRQREQADAAASQAEDRTQDDGREAQSAEGAEPGQPAKKRSRRRRRGRKPGGGAAGAAGGEAMGGERQGDDMGREAMDGGARAMGTADLFSTPDE